MEARWMSGFTRDNAPNIAANYLASSTSIFSEDLIRSLATDLEVNRQQLARELSLPQQCSFAVGFGDWCNSPGSTVFVLVSVLTNLGRVDCVQRIEQYMQMHTMQLFVKVEEASTDGQPYVTSPKFHQLTTSCEFNLVQTLENILGGDLVHYEIIGPGPWVKWNTLAKELKGRQLTLLYHDQPVPDTRAAIYGNMESHTEPKLAIVTHNIPANSDTSAGDDTHMKVPAYTQIEDLKYAPDSSLQASNSNNLMLSSSLEREKRNLESVLAEEPTTAYSFPSLNSFKNQFTLDSQTQAKVVVAGKNNTPEYVEVKSFPDKLVFRDDDSKKDNYDSMTEPLEMLNNVPYFSLLDQSLPAISPNNTLQTATKQTFQTARNHSVVYTQKSSLQVTHKPILSSSHDPTFHIDIEKKQNNLNNLNCVTMSSCSPSLFVKNSLDSQNVPKPSSPDTAASLLVAKPGSPVSQEENSQDCAMNVEDSANHSSITSDGGNINSSGTSSLFAQSRNIQQFNISEYSSTMEYIPHSCIQCTVGQLYNHDPLEMPTPCAGIVKTSPQKRYRLGHAAPSDHSPQEQAVHHQQKAWDTKQLQQESGQDSLQSALSGKDNFHAVDYHEYHLQHQKILDHPHTASGGCGSQCQQSPSCEQVQNWGHQLLEKDHQTQYIPEHQFQLLKQLQHSQNETQQLDQPFLICHTPPPRFPDEESQENYPVSEFKPRPRAQSDQFISSDFSHRSSPAKLSQTIGSISGYLTMFQPTSADIGSPRNTPSPVGSHSQISLGQSMPALLPNLEFIVRLPSANLSTQSSEHQILIPRNQSRTALSAGTNSSLESGGSFAHTRQFSGTVDEQSPIVIPRPFYPAPPRLCILENKAQMANVPSGKENLSETTSTDDEGYNFIDNGHLSRSKSLPVSRWRSPVTPRRAGLNLDDELLRLEGWCPLENGDTIRNTLEKYCTQDGSFIIWKSRRYNKFVISVSHLSKLFHFRVEEIRPENRDTVAYYLFEGGFRSESLLDLLQHYRQNGVRISMQSSNGMKTHIEHIQLRYPVRLK